MSGDYPSKVETVVLAVCLLGGEQQFVDVEDIAAAAANLAPGRFTWKRYPDQIDMAAVRRCLMSATKVENGNLVTGSTLTGWALTERGADFAKNHEEYHRGNELLVTGLGVEEQRFLAWQRKRIQAHPAFKKVTESPDQEVTIKEVESFFLLDPHATLPERQEKIGQYMRHFGRDPDIGPVVSLIARKAAEK
jgi:hypothetical protein